MAMVCFKLGAGSYFYVGCYTSFRHPTISTDSHLVTVRVGDDCRECHQADPYSMAILPHSVENNVNWYFYMQSAWWEDELNVLHAGYDIAPHPQTGPRLPNALPHHETPTSVSVSEPHLILSKPVEKLADEPREEEDDHRRNFNRHKEAAEQTKQRDSTRNKTQ